MQSMLVKASHCSKLGRCSFNLSKHSILSWDRQSNRPANHQLNQVRNIAFVDSVVNTAINTRIWLTNTIIVDNLQKGLISVHDATGMPWWLEICLTTVVLRIVLLPLVYTEKKESIKRDTIIVPQIKKKMDVIREATRRKLQLRELRSDMQAKQWFNEESKKFRKELYLKYNAHPGRRLILILGHFPVWVLTSFSIGHLCSQNLHYIDQTSIRENILHALPQVGQEGTAWFPNLMLPDPMHILPVLLMASMVTTIRYNQLVRRYEFIDIKERRLSSKILSGAIKASAILLPVGSAFVPSGLALYWTCNSMCYLTFNVMMNNAKVKRTLGLEDDKHSVGFNELLEDYKNLIEITIENLSKKLKK